MHRFVIASLIGVLAAPVFAFNIPSNERIVALETRVAELEARLTKLEEALLNNLNSEKKSSEYWVCRVSAFTQTHSAEHTNKGIAKRKAQQACEANNDALFCQPKDIRCEAY